MPTVLDLYIHPSSERVLNYFRWKNGQNSLEEAQNYQREISAHRNGAANPPPYEIAVIDLPSYHEVVERSNESQLV